MKLLRALDAALTTFVNTLWPLPPLVREPEFDEDAAADYLARRAFQYGGQLAGVGTQALMETLSSREPPLTDNEIVGLRQLLDERGLADLTRPTDDVAHSEGPTVGQAAASSLPHEATPRPPARPLADWEKRLLDPNAN
jgi:hypothetical protein